jgi:hypothetical protein
MRTRLADVYTEVFLFFRDIIEWHLKSRTSRFFGGFNEKVGKKLEETAKAIEKCIREMYREAEIGGLAMQRAILEGMPKLDDHIDQKLDFQETGIGNVHAEIEDIQRELLRQRQQPVNATFDVGNTMVQALITELNKISRNELLELAFSKLTKGDSVFYWTDLSD